MLTEVKGVLLKSVLKTLPLSTVRRCFELCCRESMNSSISWILWRTTSKPSNIHQDMDLPPDLLAFPPKPPLQTCARARKCNFSNHNVIILQLWPAKQVNFQTNSDWAKQYNYLLALLIDYTIHRNFTNMGKTENQEKITHISLGRVEHGPQVKKRVERICNLWFLARMWLSTRYGLCIRCQNENLDVPNILYLNRVLAVVNNFSTSESL